MAEFRKYRRTQVAEMADWEPGFDMAGVSISEVDKNAGSPKEGDKIARNPANHEDKWLVAAEYFAVNFEPFYPAPDSVAVPEKIKDCCDCDSCNCGNYDNAMSHAYSQGWNSCVDAMIRRSK